MSWLAHGVAFRPIRTGHRAWAARAALARACAVTAMLAYNWWILVPFKPGLMKSPSELFSNLEVTGQPYAIAMQRADMLAGVVLLAALVIAGSASIPAGRREWVGMAVFAAAGLTGGAFPETCQDSISATCRTMELSLRLPVSQYVHIVAGIGEFAGITIALAFAVRRTRGRRTLAARTYRWLAVGAVIGYPLLGTAYLTGRLGGIMEAWFFAGFTVMALAQVFERTGAPASET